MSHSLTPDALFRTIVIIRKREKGKGKGGEKKGFVSNLTEGRGGGEQYVCVHRKVWVRGCLFEDLVR